MTTRRLGLITTGKRIRNGDVELHVAVTGDGPPVLLLHGFPENGDAWRHQVAPLAEAGFSVWVPDLRGYRYSDKPQQTEAYRMHHLVADVAAIADATGHARIHLAGHDWGGIAAWSFAHAHPDRLHSLTTINAPHPVLYREQLWRSRQWRRSWYAGCFLLPWLPERILRALDGRAIRAMFALSSMRAGAYTQDEIDSYVAALLQPGALTAALNYYRANLRNGATPLALKPLDMPALVIWGERDPALDVCLLDGIPRMASDVRIHRIADASHWVPHEAHDEVTRLLVDFLTSRPSVRSSAPLVRRQLRRRIPLTTLESQSR